MTRLPDARRGPCAFEQKQSETNELNSRYRNRGSPATVITLGWLATIPVSSQSPSISASVDIGVVVIGQLQLSESRMAPKYVIRQYTPDGQTKAWNSIRTLLHEMKQGFLTHSLGRVRSKKRHPKTKTYNMKSEYLVLLQTPQHSTHSTESMAALRPTTYIVIGWTNIRQQV